MRWGAIMKNTMPYNALLGMAYAQKQPLDRGLQLLPSISISVTTTVKNEVTSLAASVGHGNHMCV